VDPGDCLDIVERKQYHESNPASSSSWPSRYTKLILGAGHMLLV
jgi:hypothetical protein